MTSVIVEVRDLTKNFIIERSLCEQILTPFAIKKVVCALSKVNFNVKSGNIMGVIGPNGAGKTTLLRILADLLEPDGGWVTLCAQRLTNKKHHLRSRIGYVSSDERSFFWRLTGRQNLEFFARLYGISGIKIQKRIRTMLNMFAITEKADQLFRDYSTGIRKKFTLARALMHQPNILLLDEITNSLDPRSTQNVKSIVREYISSRKESVGIWSTHRLEEIGEICDKVLVINKGHARFYESVSELKRKCDDKDAFPEDVDVKTENINSINTVLADIY